jgi:hypothetical protein
MATQLPLQSGTSAPTQGGLPPPHVSASSPSLAASLEGFRASHDASALSSSGASLLGGSIPGGGIPKTANFLNQLETMMNAVKKEAGALETMKAKLKDMEELKCKFPTPNYQPPLFF